MSARNKAIKGMEKSTPEWEVSCKHECKKIFVSNGALNHAPFRMKAYYDPEFWHDDGDCFALTTTRDAYRFFRMEGWTYDTDGQWICPGCSEKGGEK